MKPTVKLVIWIINESGVGWCLQERLQGRVCFEEEAKVERQGAPGS